MASLPEVDSSCGLQARALVAARLQNAADVATLEADYLAAGCEGLEDPLTAYPYLGVLRLTRHFLQSIPLPEGAAGCQTPGRCGASSLTVDLVSRFEVPASFVSLPLSICTDQLDNDGDGLVDLDDRGCIDDADDSEVDETGVYPCDDGKDNDDDGVWDYRPGAEGDPGCLGPEDLSENGTLACDNLRDDDGDGLVDFRLSGDSVDPGCAGPDDDLETTDALPCDDGKDNDGDGFRDFLVNERTGDPGCSSVMDPTELDETGTWLCDDGLDSDNDGSGDHSDHGCWTNPNISTTYSPYELDEYNDLLECDDGMDNDADGFIDYRVAGPSPGDPECLNADRDNSERN